MAWVIGIILALGVGMMGYVTWAEAHLPPLKPTDVIIVLGAQVKPDGSLSLALNRRLTLALTQYQQREQHMIVCGAQGGDEPVPEAVAMRDFLVARGIPAEHISQEADSFNTRENLRFAQEIIAQKGLGRALIVTSDYHVARALRMARQLGMEVCGVGSASEPAYWIKNHVRESISWYKMLIEELFR